MSDTSGWRYVASTRDYARRVRALAKTGLRDAEIGERFNPPLTACQVNGIRRRANPPIPSGQGRRGRPKRPTPPEPTTGGAS